MFADKLLFVEGQVDAGIIYNWAQKEQIELNFDIFGYGANGWENFYILLKLSEQLGIKKVAVLYDKAKVKDIEPVRNIHLDEDFRENRKVYADYRLLQLETEDIIDKGKGKDKKIGTFDEKGNLKTEYRDHFEHIISQLQEYFSN